MLKSFYEYKKSKKIVEKPKTDILGDTGPTGNNLPKKTPVKKNQQVKEYVDGNGKVIEKPSTTLDYKGPDPKSPPQFGDMKPFPYKSEDKKIEIGEKGPADVGTQELVYKPNTSDFKKLKSEQFIDKTKNLNLKEFTEFMVSECGCNLNNSTAQYEVINNLIKLSADSDNIFDNLVLELKRNGNLDQLIHALEAVGPPMGFDDIGNKEPKKDNDEVLDNDEDDMDDEDDDEDFDDEDDMDDEDDDEDFDDDEDMDDDGMSNQNPQLPMKKPMVPPMNNMQPPRF